MNYDLVTITSYSVAAFPGSLTDIVTVFSPAFQLAELPLSTGIPLTSIRITESCGATAVILLDALVVVAV